MILELRSDLGKLVELWGFEPQTSCMPYTLRPSPGVAGRGPMWCSPAASVAGRGLAWLGVCPRWLLTWLPGNSLAPLISMALTLASRADTPATGGCPGVADRPALRV